MHDILKNTQLGEFKLNNINMYFNCNTMMGIEIPCHEVSREPSRLENLKTLTFAHFHNERELFS